MTRGWNITGKVRGHVMLPDDPTFTGAWGLVGGEDITGTRRFLSVGAAMTWCRAVLDGKIDPRNTELAGPIGTRRQVGPVWNDAEVIAERVDHRIEQRWETGPRRGWYESVPDGRLGKLIRTDPNER